MVALAALCPNPFPFQPHSHPSPPLNLSPPPYSKHPYQQRERERERESSSSSSRVMEPVLTKLDTVIPHQQSDHHRPGAFGKEGVGGHRCCLMAEVMEGCKVLGFGFMEQLATCCSCEWLASNVWWWLIAPLADQLQWTNRKLCMVIVPTDEM